jgi:hypothetical protein
LFDPIKTVGELSILAQADQSIADLLYDTKQGRRAVALEITTKGFPVTDKLVRSWREKNLTPRDFLEEFLEIDMAPENSTVYINDIPQTPTYPTVIGYSTNPIRVEDLMPKPKPAKPMVKRIVIMPDVQAPLHDVALVEKFIQFTKDFQPTELAQVGDFTDSTEISRWVRGKKGEFAGDLQAGLDSAQRILHDIREVFDGRFRIVRSNHDDRLESYIDACAPGLSGLRALTLENLAGFNEYGVEFIRDEVVELANGWVMAHGDEGSLSPVAGKTAFGLAKNKFGVSTVCGHTHRAGMTSESTGYNGAIRNTLTGLEVGHFMDLTKADYLKKKGVAANWQQAFGILEVHGDRVYPRLITVQDGRFSVDGVEY